MHANTRRLLHAPAALAFATLGSMTACTRDDPVTSSPAANVTGDATANATPEVGGDPIAVTRPANTPAARASLRPTDGHMTSGVVEFFENRDGTLRLSVEIAELEAGEHGFHIHENGDCSASDASSAGAHFSPDGNTHGSPNDPIHHAGDLGNVVADANGIAITSISTSDLTLTGQFGVVNRAVVVDSGRDDFTPQLTDEPAEHVACGVVRIVEPPSASG